MGRRPILWLRLLPDGPMFCLDDYQYEGKPRPWISVGFGEFRDIEIPDRTVSKLHCLLYRDPATRRLFVEDAQSLNGTIVNGAVPLEDGVVELVAGSCRVCRWCHAACLRPGWRGSGTDRDRQGAACLFSICDRTLRLAAQSGGRARGSALDFPAMVEAQEVLQGRDCWRCGRATS